jgi:multiple sugar transport system permease protein
MAPLRVAARRWAARAGHALLLALFVIFTAFPFYWMLITTFKRTTDLVDTNNNPLIFNEPPTLDHLRVLLEQTQFLTWLGNTALVGFTTVVVTLLLAVPAGYALARLSGRWGQRLAIAIFLTYLIPPTILFIPFSRIVGDLGLQDSLWSLVLVYPSFTVPFCTWLLMGCSRFGAFVKVAVPVCSAGILTAVIFAFTLVLQEFVYALTFITSSSQYTVSVGVPTFLVRGDVYFWGSLMGACLIVSVPIALLFNLFVDRFVAGFTVGAIK